jgi:hypothetical protein
MSANWKLVLAGVAGVALVGCGQQEEEPPPAELDPVVNEYQLVEFGGQAFGEGAREEELGAFLTCNVSREGTVLVLEDLSFSLEATETRSECTFSSFNQTVTRVLTGGARVDVQGARYTIEAQEEEFAPVTFDCLLNGAEELLCDEPSGLSFRAIPVQPAE